MRESGIILVLGAGDLATGVAHRLHRAGFRQILTELPEPRAVRRLAAFSECVFRGEWVVEGIRAVRAGSPDEAVRLLDEKAGPGRPGRSADLSSGPIPVVVDEDGSAVAAVGKAVPVAVLVDARMAKRNLGTVPGDAPVVIGLGPGFEAGVDVSAVVETARGHDLGRAIYRGQAQLFTGVPGEVDGYSTERVLRSPADGTLRALVGIGDRVLGGQLVAEVACPASKVALAVRAALGGVVRGLLRDGAPVRQGQKIGDIDPRLDPSVVAAISDKARAVGGGVLEAILCLGVRPSSPPPCS